MRLVCLKWYNVHKARNKWKFWNSVTLHQTVHDKGIATVPKLPNGKWHGRLFSYVGAQKVPYYFCDYVLGEKHGEFMYFFTRTSQMQISGLYEHGKLHGDWRQYSIVGQLLNWRQYLNGKLHGHDRAYDPLSGKLRADTQYFDGRKHGVSKTWRWDSGVEKTTRYFVLGVEMQDLETYLRMMASLPRPID